MLSLSEGMFNSIGLVVICAVDVPPANDPVNANALDTVVDGFDTPPAPPTTRPPAPPTCAWNHPPRGGPWHPPRAWPHPRGGAWPPPPRARACPWGW